MKKREDKKKDFELLKAEFERANSVFVTGFEKMTVDQDYELRKQVRAAGGKYKVVKNNIAEKASEGTSAQDAFKGLRGMTSITVTPGDPVAMVKALKAYAKTNALFTFKSGVVEGRVIDLKGIEDLATMPPKEEIYAKLLFLILAPAQRLVTVLNAPGRDLAVVLDQGVQENKFSA